MKCISIIFLALLSMCGRAQSFRSVDVAPGIASSSPIGMVAYHGRGFFTAYDTMGHPQLYGTDGTAAGTYVVRAGLFPSTAYLSDYTVGGDKIFFYAYDQVHGEELWLSDGTDSGTHMVKDIWPGPGDSYNTGWATSITPFRGKVFFTASDSVHGLELWTSDGTDSGTYMVKDIWPGSRSARPFNSDGTYYNYRFAVFRDRLYFSANDSIHGVELWASDGTDSGTVLVADIYPGATGSDCGYIYPLDSCVVFGAQDDYWSYAPWRSDGTAAGTGKLADIYPHSATSAYTSFQYTYLHGKAFFAAADSLHGRELWVTDGTSAHTHIVKDILPGSTGSGAGLTGFATLGDYIYFGTVGTYAVDQLWRSDGTDAGTTLVKAIPNPARNTGQLGAFMQYHDHLVFLAPADSADTKLWISDGTGAGTFVLAPAGSVMRDPLGWGAPLAVVNDDLYLAAHFDSIGNELWIYHYDNTTINSITHLSGDMSIGAYPNPFDKAISIVGLQEGGQYTVDIVDASGRFCYSTTIHGLATKTPISVPDLASGVYMLRISSGSDATSLRLVRY